MAIEVRLPSAAAKSNKILGIKEEDSNNLEVSVVIYNEDKTTCVITVALHDLLRAVKAME